MRIMDESGIKKSRDTSAKRKKILEGAIKVFINKGYDGATMDKIAQTAGVSKITVYHHFENKANLFQAIVSDFLEQSSKQKPLNYDRKLTLKSQLEQFIQAELYWIEDSKRRGLSKLLTSVYLFKPEFAKETMRRHPFHQDFMHWLVAAKSDGKLDYSSKELAASVFYGLIEGCLTWPALVTDGSTLVNINPLITEIIETFLSRYSLIQDLDMA